MTSRHHSFSKPAEEPQVARRLGPEAGDERDDHGGQDERDGGVGLAVRPDAGDLAAAQRLQARARPPRRLRRLRHAAPLELRRPLAQPRAAVRALRDVRRDLGAAALADDEEIRPACHGQSILRSATTPRKRFPRLCARRGTTSVKQATRRTSWRSATTASSTSWPSTTAGRSRRRCSGSRAIPRRRRRRRSPTPSASSSRAWSWPWSAGSTPRATGVLVDEQFGSDIPAAGQGSRASSSPCRPRSPARTSSTSSTAPSSAPTSRSTTRTS